MRNSYLRLEPLKIFNLKSPTLSLQNKRTLHLYQIVYHKWQNSEKKPHFFVHTRQIRRLQGKQSRSNSSNTLPTSSPN